MRNGIRRFFAMKVKTMPLATVMLMSASYAWVSGFAPPVIDSYWFRLLAV
ncbi:hypothetical protein [Desulforegula conservatrix]|nr:hypothetical protein [Desulforegula conservatrix]